MLQLTMPSVAHGRVVQVNAHITLGDYLMDFARSGEPFIMLQVDLLLRFQIQCVAQTNRLDDVYKVSRYLGTTYLKVRYVR